MIAADVPNTVEWQQSNDLIANNATWIFGGLTAFAVIALAAVLLGLVIRGPRGPRGHGDDPDEQPVVEFEWVRDPERVPSADAGRATVPVVRR